MSALKTLPSWEQRPPCPLRGEPLSGPRWFLHRALAADSAQCWGWGCLCCAAHWTTLAEGLGADISPPCWSRERSHVSVPVGTHPSQEVPSHGRASGAVGEKHPLISLSLHANTRALLEPPCDAASRKAAKTGRLPSFCLLPSRCGWPCQADGSAPGRDKRRRQEQLAPSAPGPRPEMLSSVGSSRQANEAVTSPARLRLCWAPWGSSTHAGCAASSCLCLWRPCGGASGRVLAGTRSAPEETGISWGQPQSPALMQEPPGHICSSET